MLIKIRYWFIVYFYLLRYGAGAGQRQNRQVRQWTLDLNPFINFSRLRHLLSHTTIHHSTQQCAENIFEYQHFRWRCCIKSHYAKPPRIGLRYLPQNSKSTTFCPIILYVLDTFPRLQTGYNSTRQRAENLSINVECLRHSPQHYQRLPLKPKGEVQCNTHTWLRQLHTLIYKITLVVLNTKQ